VISYINCTAEIKAMSDIICTSSNAVQMCADSEEQPIIFGQIGIWDGTGRADWTRLVLWEGSCICA